MKTTTAAVAIQQKLSEFEKHAILDLATQARTIQDGIAKQLLEHEDVLVRGKARKLLRETEGFIAQLVEMLHGKDYNGHLGAREL